MFEILHFCMSLSGIQHDYLPAHVLPRYPAGHVHVNLLTPSLHCPLFLHGLLAHSLTSIIKQKWEEIWKKVKNIVYLS